MTEITEEEKTILTAIVQGVPRKAIASMVFMSKASVKRRIHDLQQRFEARCIEGLIYTVTEKGLLKMSQNDQNTQAA